MKDGAYDADDDADIGSDGDDNILGVKRRRRNDTTSGRGTSDRRGELSPLFHSGGDMMGEPYHPSTSSSDQHHRYGSSNPHHISSTPTPAQLYHAHFAGPIDRLARALVTCFDSPDRGRGGSTGGDSGGARVGNWGDQSGGSSADAIEGGAGGGGAASIHAPSDHGLLPLALFCTPTHAILTYPPCDITSSHIDILDSLWAQAEQEDHTARALEVNRQPSSHILPPTTIISLYPTYSTSPTSPASNL